MTIVKTFKFLCALFDANGGAEKYLNNIIQIAWSKWRETTGVMCDNSIQFNSIHHILFASPLGVILL